MTQALASIAMPSAKSIDADPRIEFIGADGQPLANDEGAVAFVLPDFDLMYQLTPTHHDSHAEAMAAAQSLGLLGYSDWLAASVKELELLVDRGRRAPATWPAIAKHTPMNDWYWSRDEWKKLDGASDPGYAWLVDFANGSVYSYHRGASGFVRAVRAVSPSQ